MKDATQPTRHIWLLGSFRIEGPHGPIHIAGKKERALLIYLALQMTHPLTREALAEVFWPEALPGRAIRNLATALYRLRQTLGDNWLVTTRATVALQAGPDLWVDAWEFERLVSTRDLTSLRQAAELYKGELAPEFYDDWVVAQRLVLHERFINALLQLGQTAEDTGLPAVAVPYYQQAIGADPLCEEAYRGLIHNLAQQGDRAEALRVYARLEQTLANELHTLPLPETQALAQALQDTGSANDQVTSMSRHTLPFIGRQDERTQLLTRLNQSSDKKGGIAVVLGEAGSGKTRLLEEIAQTARRRGWQIAWGRGEEFTLLLPFTPLRQALDVALPEPRVQQLSQIVPREWMNILGSLIPRICQVLGDNPRVDESPDRQQLTMAVHQVLGGLQQITPHLLFLDDVQWADPEVWTLLTHLQEALADLAVLIVLSGRIEELRLQDHAWQTLQTWEEAGISVVQLGGLPPADLRDLAVAYGQFAYTAEQMTRLYRASGGNPLVALTLCQEHMLDDDTTPPALAELLQRRLASISTETHSALQAAAVLGYQFRYPVWSAVVEQILPIEMMPRLVGTLEQADLIVLEDDQYRFAHDTLRAVVYTHVPAEQRRRLHQYALNAISPEVTDDTLALLYHAEQAGDRKAIARYALAAGEQALASYSFKMAVRHFTQALNVLPRSDQVRRFKALLGRIKGLDVLAERAVQQADVDTLGELAEQLDQDTYRLEALYQQTQLYWKIGRPDDAQRVAEQGLRLAEHLNDTVRKAMLLVVAGRVERDRGNFSTARAYALRARDDYRQLGNRTHEALLTDFLGGVAWDLGEYRTAGEHHSTAANMFRELGSLLQEARALNNLGSTLWMLGDYTGARDIHERAVRVCRALDDRLGVGDNIDNLGGVASALGDYPTAIRYFTTALKLRREAQDTWGIAISLTNLGDTYRLLESFDEAFACYDEALAACDAIGRRQIEAYVHHGRGLALLDAGKLTEAHAALSLAWAIRAELGNRVERLETEAALALAHLVAEELDKAQAVIAKVLAVLEEQDRPTIRQWVYYIAYRVATAQQQHTDARQHLRAAATAMHMAAANMTADDCTNFFERVPLNRKTKAALAALSHQVQVRLVRADVPLGRKLTEADYISVTWTLTAPDDEKIPTRAERRRHILQRLLTEATDQGATATDDDLAEVLEVSRRTVLRDIAQLAEAGRILSTRRRER